MKIKLKVVIDNSAEKVWKALTESEYVRQYMFGSSVRSDWESGSDIHFYQEKDGVEHEIISGKIEEIEKAKKLKHSLYPIGADYPDTEENHIHVTYTLYEDDNGCILDIEQGGFENAAQGERRYKESEAGWEHALPRLKEVAENI